MSDVDYAQTARRAEWAVVLKGAVLFTAMAIQAKDAAKAAQGREIMAKARANAGLDSAILSAIFGGEVPAVPENRLIAALTEAGKSATAEELKAAREVVATDEAARKAAKEAAYAAQKAARRESARSYNERQDALRAARAPEKAARAAEKAAAAAAKSAAVEANKAKITQMGELVAKVGAMVSTLENHLKVEADIKNLLADAGVSLQMEFGHMAAHKAIVGYALCLSATETGVMGFVNVLNSTPAVDAHRAAVAKQAKIDAILAKGGILVDGIILTEDGHEIKLEDI